MKESVFNFSSSSNDRATRSINSPNRQQCKQRVTSQVSSSKPQRFESAVECRNIRQPSRSHSPSITIVQNFQGQSAKPSSFKVLKTSNHKSCSHTSQPESEMGQDVGSCCAKYILCLFNFIFFVSIRRFAPAEEYIAIYLFSLTYRFSDRSCLGWVCGFCSIKIPSYRS